MKMKVEMMVLNDRRAVLWYDDIKDEHSVSFWEAPNRRPYKDFVTKHRDDAVLKAFNFVNRNGI